MIWTRLNIVVEGQTEEEFVNTVLRSHMSRFAVAVSARMVSRGRGFSRRRKGGLTRFDDLCHDIRRWAGEDRAAEARFTTMIDLYGYPRDAPRFDEAVNLQAYEKVRLLERGMAEAVDDNRFLPYIQLHEFETLLFADLSKWPSYFIERQNAVDKLAQSVASFINIELIDDGKASAPSKRILQHLPEYDKVVAGIILAVEIGLSTIREKCGHFDEWISRLENLNAR